ncbi:hypothetical protein Plhal710r2_c009g0041131 [Plasmopara halstedii]
MNNTPLAVRLPNTKRGCRMGRLALTYHPCVVLRTVEDVNDVALLLGQGPVACYAVFGSWNQVDLMTHTSVRR